ncbi:hypothetical protein BV22DRAFT_1038401 [Leucogyrophana mollusca]|uniref:Uncharacterized protein n=1 Tax=Leucogyrophana mollusca TaxID=85980 RepID=A0ACB8B9N5_9AGAM|nr:hypothetical protein BV22DRAFT_1038401 [Leucogyrophana mollusca]
MRMVHIHEVSANVIRCSIPNVRHRLRPAVHTLMPYPQMEFLSNLPHTEFPPGLSKVRNLVYILFSLWVFRVAWTALFLYCHTGSHFKKLTLAAVAFLVSSLFLYGNELQSTHPLWAITPTRLATPECSIIRHDYCGLIEEFADHRTRSRGWAVSPNFDNSADCHTVQQAPP